MSNNISSIERGAAALDKAKKALTPEQQQYSPWPGNTAHGQISFKIDPCNRRNPSSRYIGCGGEKRARQAHLDCW